MESQAGLEDMASTADDADALLTYCPMHPGVQTRLRCGKCGQPICPRCLVHTPVGARCRPCANLKPLPQYQVDSDLYVRALAAAVGVMIVCGIAWAYVAVAITSIYFWPAVVVGLVAGETISWAVHHKRSRGLQVIAGASVAGSFLVACLAMSLLADPTLPVTPTVLAELLNEHLELLFGNALGVLILAFGVYTAAGRI